MLIESRVDARRLSTNTVSILCYGSPNQVLTHAARAAATQLWPRAKGPGQGNAMVIPFFQRAA